MNISDLCPFITGVASFRYEIDISLPLVGVRRNRMTIISVPSESTTVTLALYSMSRRSEGLSGQATRSALTFSYSSEQHCKTEFILSYCVPPVYICFIE